jgi:hypothetical protein
MSRSRSSSNRPSYARRLTGPLVAFTAAGLLLAACGGSPSPAGGGSGAPGASGQGSGGGAVTTTAAFFPVAVGNTWVYASSLGGTVTNKMVAVKPVAGGQQVTMTDTNHETGLPRR